MDKESLTTETDFDIEDLRYFSGLSAEEKLNFVEQLQDFLNQAMPVENKQLWERLKEDGF